MKRGLASLDECGGEILFHRIGVIKRQYRANVLVRADNNYGAVAGDAAHGEDVLVWKCVEDVLPIGHVELAITRAEEGWRIEDLVVMMIRLLINHLDIEIGVFIGSLWIELSENCRNLFCPCAECGALPCLR